MLSFDEVICEVCEGAGFAAVPTHYAVFAFFVVWYLAEGSLCLDVVDDFADGLLFAVFVAFALAGCAWWFVIHWLFLCLFAEALTVWAVVGSWVDSCSVTINTFAGFWHLFDSFFIRFSIQL